jgi:hypothetical protein
MLVRAFPFITGWVWAFLFDQSGFHLQSTSANTAYNPASFIASGTNGKSLFGKFIIVIGYKEPPRKQDSNHPI